MKLIVALVLTVGALVARPLAARPCGAFFPTTESSANVALGAQRALLVLHATTIDLHLQPHAAPDGQAFAWVLPVPSEPTLALGDAAVFDALDALTQPTVEIQTGDSGGGGGFGCGSADKAGGLGDRSNGVDHFGGGTLGNYTYDIIGGSSAADVEKWLGDNGYVVPEGFAAVIAPYADKVLFVAVKLTDPGQGDVDLQPLVVTFTRPFESSLGYAAAMSKLSTTSVAPILLWVLADKRYRVANYGSVELSTVAGVMREQVQSGAALDYAAALKTLTDEAGGRLVVTEYAKDLAPQTGLAPAIATLVDADAHYLTRLYMEVPKEALEDLVVTFAANAPDVEPFATADAGTRTPATAACLLVAIAFVARRRRRAS